MDKKKVSWLSTLLLGIFAWAFLAFGIWFLSPVVSEGMSGADDSPRARLTLYEGPSTMRTSGHARITADDNELFVYDAAVNTSRANRGDYSLDGITSTPMTYFDFTGGDVDIAIEMLNTEDFPEITSATVSPLSLGITPVIEGRRVSFSVSEPGSYTVQFNGSSKRAVHIFANPPETDIPDRNDPNVVWIEPGEWNILDGIGLQSGQTLYISGGAVVHTTVSAQFAENVTVRGRGMIDGSLWDTWRGVEAHVPVDFRYCTNVNVEGIIVNNSNAWCFNSFETSGALVDNVKIISARPNGDGFTLQSCRDYTVQNSFSRTWDDSCVVKNYEGNTDNILFKNMVIWTDLAQSCEIGYETNKGALENSIISNVTFEDVTIVNAFHKPTLSIHNADDALVENVTYRNIVIENASMGLGDAADNRQLIDLTVAPSGWSSTRERGTIRNVLFENINVLAGIQTPTVRISGYDEDKNIDGVTIKNLTVFGEKIIDLAQLSAMTRFASNITVE
ncbi:MAG: hypothetical protein LBR83_03935 [Clostridiales bacterium]|nr:hypothetical protein [Clostridiales bacterium]